MEFRDGAGEALSGTQELFQDGTINSGISEDISDFEQCGQPIPTSNGVETDCGLPSRVAKRRRRNGFGKYASNRKSSSVVAMHTTQLWHLLYEYLDNNKLGDAAYVLSVLMPRAAYLSAKGSATETAIESCRAGIEVLSKTSSSRSYFSCIRLFNILQMFLRQKGIDLLQVSTDQAIYMVQHRKALEATRLLNDAMLYRKPQDAVEPIWNNSDFQNLSDSDPYDFEDSPSIVSQQSLSQLNNSEVMSAADIGVVRESVSSRVLYGHSGMLEAALWESLTGTLDDDTAMAHWAAAVKMLTKAVDGAPARAHRSRSASPWPSQTDTDDGASTDGGASQDSRRLNDSSVPYDSVPCPVEPLYAARLVHLLEQVGQHENALHVLQRCLRCDPKNGAVCEMLYERQRTIHIAAQHDGFDRVCDCNLLPLLHTLLQIDPLCVWLQDAVDVVLHGKLAPATTAGALVLSKHDADILESTERLASPLPDEFTDDVGTVWTLEAIAIEYACARIEYGLSVREGHADECDSLVGPETASSVGTAHTTVGRAAVGEARPPYRSLPAPWDLLATVLCRVHTSFHPSQCTSAKKLACWLTRLPWWKRAYFAAQSHPAVAAALDADDSVMAVHLSSRGLCFDAMYAPE